MSLTLKRNLRRQLLRGHPWVYREALKDIPDTTRSSLMTLQDHKNKKIGWGFFDPHSPIAFRLISPEKPTEGYFKETFSKALALRKPLQERTNAYRLFNGEGDRLPGLVCDIFDNVAVLQFDGDGPSEFWNRESIVDFLRTSLDLRSIIEKPRGESTNILLWGNQVSEPIRVEELGKRFLVDIERGQKTGFFLDQRENREYLKTLSYGRSVLNLFSYTGGFSIAAGLGGATQVESVDRDKHALELASRNWRLNQLDTNHLTEVQDIFDYNIAKGKWDIILCDPPSLAPSEESKEAATRTYRSLFSKCIEALGDSGHFLASSCSSHISFDDFHEILTEALSNNRKRARILRVSGQGADHPYPHACKELKYLKFFHLFIEK